MRGFWYGDGCSTDHCGDPPHHPGGAGIRPWSDIREGDNWWIYNDNGLSRRSEWQYSDEHDFGRLPGLGPSHGDGPTDEESVFG